MADNKKSFISYCDWGDIFDELEDDEAGRLVKHLFDYVRDKNPEPKDKLTKMMFIQIKQSLKRDLVKYDKYIDKQKVNGSKGGRPPKNPEAPKEPNPLLNNPVEPKKADTVTVTDTVNDSGTVSDNGNVSDIDIKEDKPASPSVSKFNFRLSMTLKEFNPILIDDWLKVRKTKKASNTKTALNAFLNEIKKSGRDKNEVLKMCVENSWAGFKSEWLKNPSFGTKPQSPHMNLQKDVDYSEEM